VWAALALAWLVGRLARPAAAARDAVRGLDALAVVGALLFHFGYYTFYIGGDHFEYRVYSHLVPLLFVSGAWLAARVLPRPGLAAAALGVFVLASWPIPWTHWRGTRDIATWREAENLTYAVAPRLPSVLAPLTRPFDRWQAWLIERYACMRHQEHVVYLSEVRRIYPTRAEGERIAWEPGHPVLAVEGVGLPAWVLPEVAIIDLHGLNDRIIARRPIDERKGRRIAHDRTPPPGYVRAFRPNVELDFSGGARALPRKRPLTDDEIRAAEARAWY
jgi:arabinofuranosyltransferase